MWLPFQSFLVLGCAGWFLSATEQLIRIVPCGENAEVKNQRCSICGCPAQAVPPYISEMAPPSMRGGLNILFQLATTIGIFVASLINWGTISSNLAL